MLAVLIAAPVVPNDGLVGHVMCGYQGWFATPGDGTGLDWFHYGKGGRFAPGSSNVDYWPDVRELGPDERVSTDFRMKDGRTAEVYSAANPKTVMRHFRWMREAGIDGVFLQRFSTDVKNPWGRVFRDRVLANVQAGAEANGRLFALMFDLSGLGTGETADVLEDWRSIRKTVQSPRYLRQNGRPVVALWGIGFNDHRKYTPEECGALIDALHADGDDVVIGIPTYWRTGDRDALPGMEAIYAKADALSPWTVGRYGTDEEARRYARGTLKGDLDWCAARGKLLLPVAFPGFSWHNMNPGSPLDQIPRRKGVFLRTQFDALRKAGASCAYVAMFDEMDEGTAIFKVANDAPEGFLTYEGLPSDFYLRLVGEETRKFRMEHPSPSRSAAGQRFDD